MMATDYRATHHEWIEAALARYQARLLDYAARLTGDTHRAADVVQDTFVRLAQQERHAIEGHLAQWLYTVCRRRALDIRRQEQRMQPLTEQHLSLRSEPAPLASDALAAHEAAQRLWASLAALTEQQQEAVRLKFQHELSYREIAGVMELTVNHVGVLLHHAFRKLRETMTTDQ